MTLKSRFSVLLIEDSPSDAHLLAVSLEDIRSASFTIDTVETLADGLLLLATRQYDVILLDLNLPDSFGIETCIRLRDHSASVPIIVLTGLDDEEKALEAVKVGAQDYLVKDNCDGALITRAIRYAVERQILTERQRQTDERLRLITEQLPAVVWTTDSTLCFTAPTTHCLLNSGSPRPRIGQSLHEFFGHPDSSCPLMVAHRKALEGESVSLDFGWQKRNLSVHVEPFRDATQHVVGTIGIALDISPQKRMRDELVAAQQVQQALFPHSPPTLPGFDIAGRAFPAEETAGDSFDFIPMANGSWGLVVGDVTGHGLGPALLMAELRAYLRVLSSMHSDVAELLMAANHFLASDLEDCPFVTLFFGRYEPGTRRLHYASAGHRGHLLRADGTVKTLESTGLPLGMRDNTGITSGDPVIIEPGDILVLPTDGFQEAATADRKMFGVQRMLDFIRAHGELPATEIIDGLRQAVAEFTGRPTVADDATIIIARCLA